MSARHLFAGAAAFALLAACQPAPSESNPASTGAETALQRSEQQSESERLRAWFDAQYDAELAYSPLTKTALGMIDDLDAYGAWDDVSENAYRARLRREAERLAHMRANFDFEALDPAAQIAYRFAEYIAEDNARQGEFFDHGLVFTQFLSPHTGLPSLLIGQHRIESVDHARAYISRLNGLNAVMNTLIDQANERAGAGVIAPAFSFPIIRDSARGMITGAPFDESGADSPLLADFRGKLAALELAPSQEAALIADAEAALRASVGPAYERLITVMSEHEALAEGAANGVWAMPRGEAYYASQLELYTTGLGMSAEEIHALGLAEVERIHGEMRDIMAEVGFEGALGEFFGFTRTDPQLYYPDTEEGRQRYLDESTAMIERVMEVAPDYFGRLPAGELEVRAVEPYRIQTATGAFYEPGSLDGARPGRYYVNLARMRDNPTHLMESLAYHEGAPGHHFQVALSQELEDAPKFQRQAWYSAYGEGWALYAESLGKEMGFFTDPYQDFGRLSYEIFRAARLVVDTGIHHYQWSEEEAAAYMMENTPFPEGDIQAEVRRYMVWPGQAVSYKIGMNFILDLRRRAQAELGEDFDWGEFHDVVLTHGSPPLSLLEDLVEAYIADTQAGRAD